MIQLYLEQKDSSRHEAGQGPVLPMNIVKRSPALGPSGDFMGPSGDFLVPLRDFLGPS